MDILSEKTIGVLEESGWKPGQKTNISQMVNYLENKGYSVFESAKLALEKFGGFRYTFIDDGEIEDFVISPEEGLGDLERKHYKRYEVIIGEELVVIGTLYQDNAILYISEVGNVYGIRDDYYIWKIGSSIFDAINNLCEGKEIKLIHEQN